MIASGDPDESGVRIPASAIYFSERDMGSVLIPEYPFRWKHTGEGSSPKLPPQLFKALDWIACDLAPNADGVTASPSGRLECLPEFLRALYDFLGTPSAVLLHGCLFSRPVLGFIR